jgi:hypothetical protein
MNEQRYDDVGVERGSGGIAPIFRLLGEGRLGGDAVDAVMAVLEAEGLPAVSQSRLARAYQIAFRPRPAERQSAAFGAVSALRRLLATLVLDLRPWARPAGVRGAGLTGCRLLFTADGYEVVIQESTDAKRRARTLIGQILRDGDPVPSAIVLLAGATQRAETEADDEGSFRFHNVAGGSYELDVWAGDDLIVCAPVMLDDRTS